MNVPEKKIFATDAADQWVIEARNAEIPPHLKSDQERWPHRYSWDMGWYVIDWVAADTRTVKELTVRNQKFWRAMEPMALEACTEIFTALAQDILENAKFLLPISQWRMKNQITNEEIPGVLFGI